MLHLFELVIFALLLKQMFLGFHFLVDSTGEYFREFFTYFIRQTALVHFIEFL